METLRKGSLAYIDSLSGLIACRVLSVFTVGACKRALVEVTARDSIYPRREHVERNVRSIVPRKAVRRRKYGTRILPYHAECDA